MSKILEPRSVEFSDYKVWIKQTNELLKRQWMMIVVLGALQMSAIYLIFCVVVPSISVEHMTSGVEKILKMGLLFLGCSFFGMRFFYTHLAYSADFSLGKGPTVIINSIVKRWRSLLLDYKYSFIWSVILGTIIMVGLLSLYYFDTGNTIRNDGQLNRVRADVSKGFGLAFYFLIAYCASRFIGLSSGLLHVYPLLACLGLNGEKYLKIKKYGDRKSELVLCIPLYPFGGLLVAMLLAMPLLSNSAYGPIVPLMFLSCFWLLCVYKDFLGYVICRDIYLGKKENEPEKAKVTMAVPEAAS